MGTLLVSTILGRAKLQLKDAAGVRWTELELLGWLNEAQAECVLVKPQVLVKNESVLLLAGSTRQALPPGGLLLIDMPRNMGADGVSPGEAVRVTAREILDVHVPTWHADANQDGKIKHFCFDLRDPGRYYVYPKAPDTNWYVDLVYSAIPADCTLNGTLQIPDIYAGVLLNLVLYRAYSKDEEYAQNGGIAQSYYAAALQSLGVKTQVEISQSPNANA